MGDFVLDVTALRQINEALSNNEHFYRRWWDLECLDYQPEVELCLITIEDLVERVNEKERIILDVRPF